MARTRYIVVTTREAPERSTEQEKVWCVRLRDPSAQQTKIWRLYMAAKEAPVAEGAPLAIDPCLLEPDA